MESDPASMAEHKHTNRWMTMLALGLLAICLLACLYILIGFPAEAQTVGGSTIDPSTTQIPASSTPYQPRRQPLASYAAPVAAPVTQQSSAPIHTDPSSDEIHAELSEVHNQLRQSQETLRQADQAQHRVRTTSALFLAVFAIIAALIVIQVYQQARAWDKDASRAVAEVEAVATELKTVRDARSEAKGTLPALLQEVGEQPLSFQEEGSAFSARAQATIDDIDDLAYEGQGRLVFSRSFLGAGGGSLPERPAAFCGCPPEPLRSLDCLRPSRPVFLPDDPLPGCGRAAADLPGIFLPGARRLYGARGAGSGTLLAKKNRAGPA